ncbi:MAG: oligopeptide transport system permease protein [Halieaceae bacterium]|jgi:oligopeptide transport system permease protein
MIEFFLKRLLGAIPTLLIIITLAFFMMRIAPGGPFDEERALPPEVEANLKAAYGLDKPLLTQYFNYLSGVVQGDLGPSFKYKDFTVVELIAQGAPVSARLGLSALTLALILGISLGGLAALHQNSWIDHVVMATAMTGIVIPNFVLAPLMALFFGVWLSWLPAGGWGGGELRHLVLPVTSLAIPYVAYIARLTRGSMIEVLRSNYIRTAIAKGIPTWAVLSRHALPAAMLPIISFLGPAAAGLMVGSVVIEQIFGLPGIGQHFIQGALNRDYTLVLGVVVLAATLLIFFNILVDVCYGLLDPRVRLAAP